MEPIQLSTGSSAKCKSRSKDGQKMLKPAKKNFVKLKNQYSECIEKIEQ